MEKITASAFLLLAATLQTAASAPAKDKPAGNSNCSTASDPKPASANNDANGTEQGHDQQDQEKARQKLIEQQDKQWLHDLQGIYGG